MTRIGLLSDTHGYLDPQIFNYLKECKEIWHAGDFGNRQLAEELEQQSGLPLRGVYGNIDGYDIRSVYPEENIFNCEDLRVYMKHIGGYPGRYAPGVKARIQQTGSRLFISGHSHILKIQYDPALQCLHMNPGAAGKQGWHKVRTLIRFTIDGDNIRDCEVIELGNRGWF
jgi:putative phosphoesterase